MTVNRVPFIKSMDRLFTHCCLGMPKRIYVLPYYKISMLVVIDILGGGPFVFKGIRGARRIFDQNKQYVYYPKTNHKMK